MRVALMVEGQEDVSWAEWLALARACEESGIEALFRSDHYAGLSGGAPRASLDAWTQIAALAAVTTTLRLGTLVSPVTFRHPSLLAKAVVTADHVSGGRVELGLGTGWNAREHEAYGFPFPDLETRLQLLEEQCEIVVRSWTEERVDFSGRHYRLRGLRAEPKPLGRIPLIVGGSARPRTVRLAARWGAAEVNSAHPTLADCRERAERVRRLGGGAIRFTVMTGCVVGRDRRELLDRVARTMERMRVEGSPEAFVRDRSDVLLLGDGRRGGRAGAGLRARRRGGPLPPAPRPRRRRHGAADRARARARARLTLPASHELTTPSLVSASPDGPPKLRRRTTL